MSASRTLHSFTAVGSAGRRKTAVGYSWTPSFFFLPDVAFARPPCEAIPRPLHIPYAQTAPLRHSRHFMDSSDRDSPRHLMCRTMQTWLRTRSAYQPTYTTNTPKTNRTTPNDEIPGILRSQRSRGSALPVETRAVKGGYKGLGSKRGFFNFG